MFCENLWTRKKKEWKRKKDWKTIPLSVRAQINFFLPY